MAELCTARGGISDEVGDCRDKAAKDQVLDGNASARSDGGYNRYGQDEAFVGTCIGKDSLHSPYDDGISLMAWER